MTAPLSHRQIEVLRHVAAGRTSKEIAAALGIGERTVNWHLAQIFDKLGAENRVHAVMLALDRGALAAGDGGAGSG